MGKLFSLLGKFPAPYFIGHMCIALLLYLLVYSTTYNALAGCLAGSMFYVGREIRDREKLGYWDWPGLLAPVSSSIIVYFGIERFF